MDRAEVIERATEIKPLFEQLSATYSLVDEVRKLEIKKDFYFLPKAVPPLYIIFRLAELEFSGLMFIEAIVCYFVMKGLVYLINEQIIPWINHERHEGFLSGYFSELNYLLERIDALAFVPKKYMHLHGMNEFLEYDTAYEIDDLENVDDFVNYYERDFENHKYFRTDSLRSKKALEDIRATVSLYNKPSKLQKLIDKVVAFVTARNEDLKKITTTTNKEIVTNHEPKADEYDSSDRYRSTFDMTNEEVDEYILDIENAEKEDENEA